MVGRIYSTARLAPAVLTSPRGEPWHVASTASAGVDVQMMQESAQQSESPIRLAVVGCGGSRRSFGPALRECADLQIAAYVDPDPVASRVWNRYLAKAPTFSDVPEMLQSVEVDAALITSPSPGRITEALQVVTAGKHVLCELPMAGTLPDYDRLADAAATAGAVVMPVLPRRCHAVFCWAKEAVDAGAIGVPQQLRAEWRFYAGWANRRARLRRWRELFVELAAHTLDLGTWFLGQPLSVSGDVDLQAGSTAGRQMGNIIVQHARGHSIHHIARTERLEAVEQYHLTGTEGSIQISYGTGWSYDDMSGYTAALSRERGVRAAADHANEVMEPPAGPHPSPYELLLRRFAARIRDGEVSAADLAQARLISEQLVAAALSCIEESKVSLPVIESPHVVSALRAAGWLEAGAAA